MPPVPPNLHTSLTCSHIRRYFNLIVAALKTLVVTCDADCSELAVQRSEEAAAVYPEIIRESAQAVRQLVSIMFERDTLPAVLRTIRDIKHTYTLLDDTAVDAEMKRTLGLVNDVVHFVARGLFALGYPIQPASDIEHRAVVTAEMVLASLNEVSQEVEVITVSPILIEHTQC